MEDPSQLGLWRTSALVGQQVLDANGRDAGKIEDLNRAATSDVDLGLLTIELRLGDVAGIGQKPRVLQAAGEHQRNERTS